MSLKKLLMVLITMLLIITGCSSEPNETEDPVVADPEPIESEPEPDEPEPSEVDPFNMKFEVGFPNEPATGSYMLEEHALIKPYLNIGFDTQATNVNLFLIELSGNNPRTIYEFEHINFLWDQSDLGASNWFNIRHHNPNESEEMIDFSEFSELIKGTVTTFTGALGLDYQTYMDYTEQARNNSKIEKTFNINSDEVDVIQYQFVPTETMELEKLSFDEWPPTYISIMGQVGEQSYSKDLNYEFINQYVGENIEYRFIVENPENDNPVEAYYNFAQRIIDEAQGNHPYTLAYESMIDELISENTRYRVSTRGNPNQSAMFLEREFIESSSNPDFENIRINLEIFLASLPEEVNALSTLDEATSNFERMLNEESLADEHVLINGGHYLLGVEKSSFNYGTRIYFISFIDEAGELAPIPE